MGYRCKNSARGLSRKDLAAARLLAANLRIGLCNVNLLAHSEALYSTADPLEIAHSCCWNQYSQLWVQYPGYSPLAAKVDALGHQDKSAV